MFVQQPYFLCHTVAAYQIQKAHFLLWSSGMELYPLFFLTSSIFRTNWKLIFLNWLLTFSRCLYEFPSYFISIFYYSSMCFSFLSHTFRLIVMHLCSYNLFVIGTLCLMMIMIMTLYILHRVLYHWLSDSLAVCWLYCVLLCVVCMRRFVTRWGGPGGIEAHP